MLLSLDLLPPGEMSIDVIGSGVAGGRIFLGFAQAIDMTGGGLVGVRYDKVCKFARLLKHKAAFGRPQTFRVERQA